MKTDLHELGTQRLDVLNTAASREEFIARWPEVTHEYPFTWGECWKATMTFRVPDYPAEFAFFVDVLGLRLFAHWDDHAMLTTPDQSFIITLGKSKNPDRFDPSSLQLDMMIGNLAEASASLRSRGVDLMTEAEQEAPNSPMQTTTFTTPNGILVKLWGMEMPEAA